MACSFTPGPNPLGLDPLGMKWGWGKMQVRVFPINGKSPPVIGWFALFPSGFLLYWWPPLVCSLWIHYTSDMLRWILTSLAILDIMYKHLKENNLCPYWPWLSVSSAPGMASLGMNSSYPYSRLHISLWDPFYSPGSTEMDHGSLLFSSQGYYPKDLFHPLCGYS